VSCAAIRRIGNDHGIAEAVGKGNRLVGERDTARRVAAVDPRPRQRSCQAGLHRRVDGGDVRLMDKCGYLPWMLTELLNERQPECDLGGLLGVACITSTGERTDRGRPGVGGLVGRTFHGRMIERPAWSTAQQPDRLRVPADTLAIPVAVAVHRDLRDGAVGDIRSDHLAAVPGLTSVFPLASASSVRVRMVTSCVVGAVTPQA
jgi:hypothetical protein